MPLTRSVDMLIRERDDAIAEAQYLEDKLAAASDAVDVVRQWARDLHFSHGDRPLSRREILVAIDRICETAEYDTGGEDATE